MLQELVSGDPNKPHLLPVGSGTGFCVAQGNYVVTNHHVIAHAKQIRVHLQGEQKRHTAKLIADNESGDMAILQIELPAGKTSRRFPWRRRAW